ncbi:MAG: HAD family phosphatase, partial [Candidatus Eremiobacteraeota bacterium]|nr:HAD family phosphatase [Candidatus Eremiobacteraeota bacterium]
ASLAVVAIPNRAFPPDQDALSLAALVLKELAQLDAHTIHKVLKQR